MWPDVRMSEPAPNADSRVILRRIRKRGASKPISPRLCVWRRRCSKLADLSSSFVLYTTIVGIYICLGRSFIMIPAFGEGVRRV
jgi:hypothetical protein